MSSWIRCLRVFFFFNDTATTEIYTLSLHDALPISRHRLQGREVRACGNGGRRTTARRHRAPVRRRRHARTARRGGVRRPLPVLRRVPAAITAAGQAVSATSKPATLRAFVLYFLKLGTLGFGGPIALAGHMQRDLVDERGWISREDYKQGLALAQLAPGPLAAQLAMYLGWVRGRVLGATLVGMAFVAPSLLMVLALAALYVRFGGLAWMQGLFYRIRAAVIAIIARSATKIVGMTLGRDRLLWGLFAVSLVVTTWTASEVV